MARGVCARGCPIAPCSLPLPCRRPVFRPLPAAAEKSACEKAYSAIGAGLIGTKDCPAALQTKVDR